MRNEIGERLDAALNPRTCATKMIYFTIRL